METIKKIKFQQLMTSSLQRTIQFLQFQLTFFTYHISATSFYNKAPQGNPFGSPSNTYAQATSFAAKPKQLKLFKLDLLKCVLLIPVFLFAGASHAVSCLGTQAQVRASLIPGINDINPRCAVNVDSLLAARTGFARYTQGANRINSRIYNVDSLADDGVGTLRDAMRHSNVWVLLNKSGTIRAKSRIVQKDQRNVTIDGRYAQLTLSDHAMRFTRARHLIVNNFTITDTELSNISIFQSDRVFVTHMTFGESEQSAFNVHRNYVPQDYDPTDDNVKHSNITLSWSRIEDKNKSHLFGYGNDNPINEAEANIRVSLSNNYYVDVQRRTPLAFRARVHMYNNVVGFRSVAVETFKQARVKFEYNHIRAHGRGELIRYIPHAASLSPGFIESRDNLPTSDSRNYYELQNHSRLIPARYWYQTRDPVVQNDRCLQDNVERYAGASSTAYGVADCSGGLLFGDL